MDKSILNSIKKLLGLNETCTDFDTDIIIHINTVFMQLHQLGVGTEDIFHIEDSDAIWDDFLEDDYNFEAIKTFIYLKVKLLFDPPLSSAVNQAINENIKEIEWRLSIQSDNKEV